MAKIVRLAERIVRIIEHDRSAMVYQSIEYS